MEDSMIKIIRDSFNVTKTPTVIAADKKFEELTKLDDLYSVICNGYKEPPAACKNYKAKD